MYLYFVLMSPHNANASILYYDVIMLMLIYANILMLINANIIILLYAYVCRQNCLVNVCIFVYVYVLTSIFMQVDMHKYVGMDRCMYLSRQVGRHA